MKSKKWFIFHCVMIWRLGYHGLRRVFFKRHLFHLAELWAVHVGRASVGVHCCALVVRRGQSSLRKEPTKHIHNCKTTMWLDVLSIYCTWLHIWSFKKTLLSKATYTWAVGYTRVQSNTLGRHCKAQLIKEVKGASIRMTPRGETAVCADLRW